MGAPAVTFRLWVETACGIIVVKPTSTIHAHANPTPAATATPAPSAQSDRKSTSRP
ncbi:MAG: hypothetical protein KIS63_07965 [Caldilineales bacterium]|nr:hypothetical protein [Caldilineales bacterium]